MKITGKVVHGKKIGGHHGVATANIEMKNRPDLQEGVYVVEVEYNGKNYEGVMHFGHRATFDNDFV
ncbi:bifunctional riboflavin kinase/FAD synthetase, partial [Candidatus Gracilibacteria bacterium]|nr:bifunctional riboflavin kinase/FAD synthetase [Candidatus Gracilibacteria bacterium]